VSAQRHERPVRRVNPSGKVVWYASRPHEMRHSYVSHLRAARVDYADLAAIAGHTVLTMVTHYTHALGKSFDQVRGVIG
jgi:site-specific recombinase XerD